MASTSLSDSTHRHWRPRKPCRSPWTSRPESRSLPTFHRVLHPGGRHRLREHRQVLQPRQYFLSPTGVDAQLLQQPGRGRRVRDDVGELGFMPSCTPASRAASSSTSSVARRSVQACAVWLSGWARHMFCGSRVPVHSVTTSAPSSAAWVISRTAWAVCWARNSRSGWMTLLDHAWRVLADVGFRGAD